jgi:subtilisin family serine protease
VARSELAAVVAVELPASDREAVLAAARDLRGLDAVEYVYLEPLGVPPPGDIDPVSDDFTAMQGYQAVLGADVAEAGGATGGGIKLIDCEYGWDLAHEDLVDIGAAIEPGQTISQMTRDNGWDDHGTAVLGMLAAGHNGYGVSGMVPASQVLLFPENSEEAGARRVDAIGAAIAAASPGDVILLEMQVQGPGGGDGPAELDPTVWDLVDAATAAGITVVAAAGNGAQDLDSDAYQEYRSRGDSGAIIVGAGASAGGGAMDFSTHGGRVDVHGWGENVVTTGYGDLAMFGGDEHQSYTSSFSGTSSASPMVAAAAVAIQSATANATGRVLSPRQLRQLLVDTGTPQGDGGHIGPMPDLGAALDALADIEPEPCDYWTEYWCSLNDCSFCPAPQAVCGDGMCNGDETAATCAGDCSDRICGDFICDGEETAEGCPEDCGCAAQSCGGVAPIGCWCDGDCAEHGDCCPDVDVCG